MRGAFSLEILREVVGANARRVQQFVLRPSGTDNVDEAEVAFARLPEAAFIDVVEKLRRLPGVTQVETPDLT